MIIVITLKGAIQDFYNLLTAPQPVSNMLAQVTRVRWCANHVHHIKGLSHTACLQHAGQGAVVCKSCASHQGLITYSLSPTCRSGCSGVQIMCITSRAYHIQPVSNMQVRVQWCANHVHHIKGLSHTTCLQHTGQGAVVCKSCASHQGLITYNLSPTYRSGCSGVQIMCITSRAYHVQPVSNMQVRVQWCANHVHHIKGLSHTTCLQHTVSNIQVRVQWCANHVHHIKGLSHVQPVSNMQVRVQWCANHVHHIKGLSHTTCLQHTGQGAVVCKSCASHQGLITYSLSPTCRSGCSGVQIMCITSRAYHIQPVMCHMV